MDVKNCFFRVRREVGCFVGGSFRASRLAMRRCLLGLGVGGCILKFRFFFGASWEARSFRASRLGLRRCVQGFEAGGWMLKFVFFFGCFVRLAAS